MILESWGISDIGGKRIVNEDFFFIIFVSFGKIFKGDDGHKISY